MAAGPVQLPIKDGGGSSRNMKAWSSDGTLAGDLETAIHIIDGENETQGAKADVAYAGSGAATIVAILKGLYNLLAGAIPAGANVIGSFLSRTSKVAANAITVTSGSAYASGNVVGGKLTFASVFDSSNSGVLQSIRVRCKSVQSTGLKLYLFTADPSNSTWTDKGAPAINAADIPGLVGPFTLGSGDSGLGTETTWELDGIGASIVSATSGLFGILVCTGTPTFASAGDLAVELTTMKD